MKFLPFKILILCILLPPLLYVASVNMMERRINHVFYKDLKNTYLSGITDILNGQISLKQSVNNVISAYLDKQVFLKLGGKINISVMTKSGTLIYPAYSLDDAMESLPMDPVKLAENNFDLLNEGIDIQVEAKIPPFSGLAILILLFYLGAFLTGLYIYYRRALQKAANEEETRKQELQRLRMLENDQLKNIESLADERKALLSDYERLKKLLDEEKRHAEKTEEDLFDEIESLEKRLSENLALQEQQHQEIENLKEKIQELEKTKEIISKHKQKEADKLEKRFKTLYKNIHITPRAIENLADMTEEMALKAEEVIHQLNDDASAVGVKRKVFTKKGNITAFEVIFAYSGRLYFRKTKENKVEILTIGTKNTQAKDLAYLDNI